ncbi:MULTISPECIES: hypothetical protein [unclassified Cupriavidus]|uniref:hypothetical protein n=1 Tax=unclassified Cupriavidus TaxID=2640874 RepID=UPI001C004F11|nr:MULTISPECIES: hypothetical protein [unclassified Cupriavidus]MCA3186568.1 hypothetical protein [Cupriavidus sp.]MCA3191669.1 hypothetical protein [Cupriavidus sp.]MCA3200339.1 hypothetical protein [Cupriavidus sp.]MCA3233185.1 hypothetical protein [Cupriavidus sp.]QWE93331.1 hypothetical protein KLP38_09790 [Cupriavidus sp. EM10]
MDEEFEKWADAEGYSVKRSQNDNYRHANTEDVWRAWQASRKQAIEVTEAMQVAGARSLIDGQENRPGSSWADEAKLCFEAMQAEAIRAMQRD